LLTLLNIGNTHTGIARWDGSGIEILSSRDTAGFDPAGIPGDAPVAIASVVPELSERIKKSRPDAFFVTPEKAAALLDFSPVDPSTLGADRIANAIAAAGRYPLPVLIADCGSAVTIELVDDRHRFCGGAILPGRKLMRQALFQGTAQLPDGISLSASAPEAPGRNTASSIAFGVDRGAVGALRELVDVIRRSFPLKSLILTGGDAPFFAAELPEFTVADADFTFYGILLAAGNR